jgi:FecR protein
MNDIPGMVAKMTLRSFFRSILLLLFALLFTGVHPAVADSSHARIIRLSLVQGDVRFARDTHGDPLNDQKAVWETAVLNLPIRQGYVVATDNGRAEVEFENGAMAFLNENTVLEFYDLSLDDGARTTRLVLRQGTASFYVNPGGSDYFSVTGGDFTVEVSGRAGFRMDNFDDGSNVNVLKGYVNVRHKDDTTPLEKGQSLTMRTGEDSSVNVGRLPENDDFDRWVSGREDSVVTATTAAMQYTSSPYYSSGFADLYTYGSWYPIAGYGNCWRPYGVGLGWSPFDYGYGNWYSDPVFGWSFIGYQPWGWLPYHFGGWIFEPGFGWVWAPTGFGVWNRRVPWRPVTAVWVRSGGTLGIVPSHPLDVRGKAPLNLGQGVMSVGGRAAAESVAGNSSTNWKVLKQPPREALVSSVAASSPPARLSRTVLAGNGASRVVTLNKDSSIAYDPHEHRFVNNNAPPQETKTENRAANGQAENAGTSTATATHVPGASASERAGISTATVTRAAGAATVPERAGISSATVPRPPRNMTPPPPPRASGFGGGSSAGSSRWSASGRSSAPSAPASHSAPAPSGHPH